MTSVQSLRVSFLSSEQCKVTVEDGVKIWNELGLMQRMKRERERETDRQTDRQRDRKREMIQSRLQLIHLIAFFLL